MNRPKVTNKDDLLAGLHRAAVEVFTLQQARRRLTDSSRPGILDSKKMAGLIRQVELKFNTERGSIGLEFPSDDVQDMILEGTTVVDQAEQEIVDTQEASEETLRDVDEVEKASESPAMEAATAASPVGEAPSPSPDSLSVAATPAAATAPRPISKDFLAIPLEDPSVKFAVRLHTLPCFQPTNKPLDPQTNSPTHIPHHPRPIPILNKDLVQPLLSTSRTLRPETPISLRRPNTTRRKRLEGGKLLSAN